MDSAIATNYTDGGRGHLTARFGWVPAAILLLPLGIALYDLHSRRQILFDVYWLWYDGPPVSYAHDIYLIACAAVALIFGVFTCLAVRKNEIHILHDACEGYAFRLKGLHRLRPFRLKYDEIKSIKVEKRTLDIRSAAGNYRVFVSCPRTCEKFIQKHNNTGKPIPTEYGRFYYE